MIVPDVFGLTLAQASIVIIGEGLVVGNVTFEDQQASLLIPRLIRSAHAQHCPPGTVASQLPRAFTEASLGTAVHLELCVGPAPIPEPSSLALFAVGLGLLMLFTWSRRRLQ